MTYALRLTRDDIAAIALVSSRGYATKVWSAYIHAETITHHCPASGCEHDPDCLHDVTVDVSESAAWAIQDELDDNGGHGFGPVCACLESKLYAFLAEVV